MTLWLVFFSFLISEIFDLFTLNFGFDYSSDSPHSHETTPNFFQCSQENQEPCSVSSSEEDWCIVDGSFSFLGG